MLLEAILGPRCRADATRFSRVWFEREVPRNHLKVVHWDASHEDGQAFELVLQKT
jgi:hypothetical protein